MSWLEDEIERNRRKKRLKSGPVWFLAGVVIAVAVIAVVIFVLPYSDDMTVPVVYIEGTIDTGSYTGGDYIGSEYVGQQIRRAADDPMAKAIVLRVDSPGGSATAAEEIVEDIEYARAKKPVFVSMGAMATSAAYLISSHADMIYASPDTMTGGIGTIMTFYDLSKSLEDEGIDVSVVKSGEFKDFGSQYRTLTGDEYAYAQSLVDDSSEFFINDVLEQRNISREDIEEAQIYRGEDAKEIGLIDEFGNLYTTIDAARDYRSSY